MYVPNGSYLEDANAPGNADVNISPIPNVTYTGISVVPLSSGGTKTQIDTPNAVNSCASNPNTGVVVCTSNENDIYIINAATNTITTTLQSAGNATYPFFSSGGACVTCGVAVNPADNTAVIGVSTDPTTSAGMSGYQVLNLATNTLSSVFTVTGNHGAEAWSIDTDRNLLLSPTENVSFSEPDCTTTTCSGSSPIGPWSLTQPANFQLFDLSLATTPQYDYSETSTLLDPNSELDTAVQDNTGVTMVSAEFTGDMLMTDLSQKTTTGAGNPASWDAPSQLQNLPELGPPYLYDPNWSYNGPASSYFISGASAMSIATGSHYGFLEDEFGAGAIGAFILPATTTPGSSTPVWDWVLASMPNDPVTGTPWQNPYDPHGLAAAYATIGSGDAYGVLMNSTYNATQQLSFADVNGNSSIPYSRTSVAVVSLPKLLAAPRVSSCTQTAMPIATIVEAGSTVTVVTGTVDTNTQIVTPMAHGFTVGEAVTIGDLFNGWVVDDSGNMGYNGTFTITSVPDSSTFTYTDSATGLGGLLTAGINPEFGGANATGSVCTPDFSGHYVDPTYDLVANGVIRFFPVH